MATLGNVVQIVISGKDDTAGAAKSAGANLAKIEAIAKQSALALAGMATAAAAAGVILVRNAINSADEMGKMAQSAGITTEFLSGMAYAADLSGVSLEGLQRGFKELNLEITKDSKSLRELKIETVDAAGKFRSVEEILPQIADQFADMEDGARKAQLANELFGKAGIELIPFLNQGSAGLKELTEEARRFGLIVDSDTAKQSEEFNDNLTRLQAAAKGLGMKIADEMLPHLVKFSETLVNIASQEKPIDAFFATMNARISESVPLYGRATESLAKIFAQFQLGMAGIDINDPDVKRQLDSDSEYGESDPPERTVRIGVPNGSGDDAPMDPSRFDWVWESYAKEMEMLKELSVMKDEFLIQSLEGETRLLAEEEMRFTRRLEQIEELGLAEEEYRSLKESAEREHSRRVAQIAEDEQKKKMRLAAAYLDATGNMFGAFAQLAQALGKKQSKAYKGLMYTQTVVSTAAGIMRAYAESNYWLATIQAATIAAAGAAQLATISGAGGEGGIAHGGMTYVPSESTYLVNKGERILSPEQNQDFTEFMEGSGGGGPTHIHVSVDGRELFQLITDGTKTGQIEIASRSIVS